MTPVGDGGGNMSSSILLSGGVEGVDELSSPILIGDVEDVGSTIPSLIAVGVDELSSVEGESCAPSSAISDSELVEVSTYDCARLLSWSTCL